MSSNPDPTRRAEYQRRTDLLIRYGMTPEDYEALYDQQQGCCAICRKHSTEFRRRLCVDHDHTTGRTRSLLCDNCNHVLGKVHDDAALLRTAADYLDCHALED